LQGYIDLDFVQPIYVAMRIALNRACEAQADNSRLAEKEETP